MPDTRSLILEKEVVFRVNSELCVYFCGTSPSLFSTIMADTALIVALLLIIFLKWNLSE